MPSTKLVYAGGHKRVLKPSHKPDVRWLDFCNPEMEPAVGEESNRAACVFSARLFEQLCDKDFWHNLPISTAQYQYRSDWLDRRWDHLIFSHVLQEHGMPTHFQSLVDAKGQEISAEDAASSSGPVYLQVLKSGVITATEVSENGQDIYYYPPILKPAEQRLVPIEVRYYLNLEQENGPAQRIKNDPGYARRLGLDQPPRGSHLERPVLEFYTGQEKTQRLLDVQEALLVSGLTPGQFEELVEMSYCAALALAAILGRRSLELGHGLLEFSAGREGLVLTDTLSCFDMGIQFRGLEIRKLLESPHWAASLANQLIGQPYFAAPSLSDLSTSSRKN